jgi:hypothetical protein
MLAGTPKSLVCTDLAVDDTNGFHMSEHGERADRDLTRN